MDSPAGRADASFHKAIILLRGSLPNYLLCWVSTALSCVFVALGITFMEEDENGLALATKKAFAAQSVVFLISQAFTLAKTNRDTHVSKSDATLAVLKPTLAYLIQVFGFFVLALICATYSLIVSSTVPEWRAFFAMAIVWIMLSVLCLSRAIRDRHEAQSCESLPAEAQELRLQHIYSTCRGTLEFVVLVWGSALISVALMLGTMWSWSSDVLAVERKGYFSGMILWSWVSAFHLAKLVRDRADPVKLKELSRQIPYQALIVSSAVLSTASLIVGAVLMPLALRHRLFLLAGACFTISAAFFLAKLVRDRQEVERLKELPGDSDVCAIGVPELAGVSVEGASRS